jgi:RNase P subunit RPR2
MMNNKILSVFGFFMVSIILLASCENETSKKKPLNPNGDTELALLMRAMYDEGELMKEALAKGEKHKLSIAFETILTAHATEPDKAASPEFKAFAKNYINIMNAYKESSAEQLSDNYHSMVSNCKSCHEALCPGPLVRIKKLEI